LTAEKKRRLARLAEEAIAALAREMLRSAAPIHLQLDFDPTSGRARAAGEPLEAQIARAAGAERGEESAAVLALPGAVFCFRCGGAECAHARPPGPREVFDGYSPTGQPGWKDFAQVLVEARHERVDEVFGTPPATLAVVRLGRELKRRQLHPFGRSSKQWDLLGQVAVGFFGAGEPGREALFAVTAQAIESRTPGGRIRVLLNLVGQTPAGTPAQDDFAAGADAWFHGVLREARRRLGAIEDALACDENGLREASRHLRRVPGVLHDVRRAVERADRQRHRRTRHAAERRQERRPTAAALRDAIEAGDGAIFADARRGTLIVAGPRGRTHAFTEDGRLVTSLVLERDERQRRIEKERWRPATPEEIGRFRSTLSCS
jgi:hypothetical protein